MIIFHLLLEFIGLISLCGPIELARIVKHSEFWSIQRDTKLHVNHAWKEHLSDNNGIIAHRLGSYESENTIDAALESLKKGIKILEVDLYQIEDNRLMCHHGPEPPTDKNTEASESCTLSKLIKELSQHEDVYLIVDIKTDFRRALKAINKIKANPDTGKSALRMIILQIYSPRNISDVVEYFGKTGLHINAPIVTLYNSFSKASIIEKNIPQWIGALTIPKQRIGELNVHSSEFRGYLMTHPVSSCKEISRYSLLGIKGFYGPSSLSKCFEVASPST